MKTNFDAIMEFLLKDEGGYVDHPSDPGGATNMGITRKTLARWRKVVPYTKLDKSEVKNLTKAEAKDIYKAYYWDEVQGDLLPSGVDYAVFDYAVHSGPVKSAKALQALVKVDVDGRIGNKTLAAVAEADPVDLINLVQRDRMNFLRSLGTFAVFGKGWKARVNRVTAEALKLTGRIEQKADDGSGDPDAKDSGESKIGKWVSLLTVLGSLILALINVFRKQ